MGVAVFAPLILNLFALLLGSQLMVVVLLIDAFKGLYNMFRSEESKKLEEATTALSDAHKELAVNIKEVDDAFAGTSNKIFGTIAAYTAMDNVLSQFNDKFKDVNKRLISALGIDTSNSTDEDGKQLF